MTSFLDKTASLTPITRRIVCEQATEPPHSGVYSSMTPMGTYLCRRCGIALFRADSQFSAGCGWPSFDVAIPSAVARYPDEDGLRTEIRCQRCDAHLGHVFSGEHFTEHNTRYCVNSRSLDFVASHTVNDSEEVIVAGGCFWGVDYYLRRLPGVLQVEVGYTGGGVEHPTYSQICQGNTGHYEAVRVIFDTAEIDAQTVLKRFFEIHDPTQSMRQGPDVGLQYHSAVFCYPSQRTTVDALIQALTDGGYAVATHVLPVQPFWPAEAYHQDYYVKQSNVPYCHQPVARFKP